MCRGAAIIVLFAVAMHNAWPVAARAQGPLANDLPGPAEWAVRSRIPRPTTPPRRSSPPPAPALAAVTVARTAPTPALNPTDPDDRPRMNVFWDNGAVMESADKAFRLHVGGRFDFDNTWYHQSSDLPFDLARRLRHAPRPAAGRRLDRRKRRFCYRSELRQHPGRDQRRQHGANRQRRPDRFLRDLQERAAAWRTSASATSSRRSVWNSLRVRTIGTTWSDRPAMMPSCYRPIT